MPAEKRLTRAACRDYLDETTFRLRPKEYCEKYPKWPGAVGLEIEMLPVGPVDPSGIPSQVTLQGEGLTSASLLRAEAIRRGWRTEDTEDDHGQHLLLKIDLDDGSNFSFEPGGQVEFSSKPYPCLSDAVRRMREMQAVLDQLYAQAGLGFVQVGIDPWHAVSELGLQMRKGRYRAMDRHFAQISEYGQRMMRQTCTVQVNLDFGPDEATLARRYLASQLLAPVAAATFAYSPIVDRQAAGVPGFRSRIWRHADPSRTGLPGLAKIAREPGRRACIESYLDFVLDASVVFVTSLDFKNPSRKITFGQWLEQPIDGVLPTLGDFLVHLTLMFPEVRPRGFLELRSIDCQARAFEAVPAAYWTGLLYDDGALDRLLHLLMPLKGEADALLVRAERGLADRELARLATSVMQLAETGFSALPSCFKSAGGERELSVYAHRFTYQGRTPADDVLDSLKLEDRPFLPVSAYRRLENLWTNELGTTADLTTPKAKTL